MNQYAPPNINPQVMYWNPTVMNNNSLQLQLQHIGLRNNPANRHNPAPNRRPKNRPISSQKGKYPLPNIEPLSGYINRQQVPCMMPQQPHQPERTPSSLLPLSLESMRLSHKTDSSKEGSANSSKIETAMLSRYTVRSDLTNLRYKC